MTGSGRHLVHVFSTFDPGGPQVRTADLLGLMPPGWRHTVVAMDGRTGAAGRIPGHVPVALAPAPPKGCRRALPALLRLLRTLEPDLVLTYNWGSIEAVLAARLSGRRALVHHEEGFGPEEARGLLWRRTLARRLLLPGVRAVVVPSQALWAIARRRWGVREGRLHRLPNGVDLDRFRPPGERVGGGPLVIGAVGGLRPEKDQGLLLAAVAREGALAGARLLLVGDGPERDRLAALAAALGLAGRVEFAGAVADPAPYYRRMDIFALPSRTEQLPLALLEAMATALPVAATAVGDVAAALPPESRPFVVPAGDEAGLGRALAALALNASLRHEVGAANRTRCRAAFSREECAARYLGLYARCLALRRPGGA